MYAESKMRKCEKLSNEPSIIKNNAHVIVNMLGTIDELGWEGEEIYETGENFGCIHFEQK